MNIIKNDQLRSFLTIFILSLVFFIYQFSIFREIKFQIPTVVFGGPLVVCFALFFTGLGPLLSKLFIKDKESRFHYILLFLPIIFLLSYLSMIYISQMLGPYYNPENFYKIVSQEISTYSPPFTQYLASLFGGPIFVFILQGIVLDYFFKKGKKDDCIAKYYLGDVLGAGVGALLAGFVTIIFSPFNAVFLSSTILIFLILFLSKSKIYYLFPLLIFTFYINIDEFKITTPSYLKNNNIFSKWGPYQRVDVLQKDKKLETYSDGMLFYPIYKDPKGSIVEEGHQILKGILEQRKFKNILMIGTGMGNDVYNTRLGGLKELSIDAVEIDPTFIEASQKVPWLFKQYSTANIIKNEGRNYLEKSNKKYDLIYFASADPKAGISQASFPDATFLYTKESFKSALESLKPNGILLVKIAYIIDGELQFLNKLNNTLQSASTNYSFYPLLTTSKIYSIDFGKIKAVYGVIEKSSSPSLNYGLIMKNHDLFRSTSLITEISSDNNPINITAKIVDNKNLALIFFVCIILLLFTSKIVNKISKHNESLFYIFLGLTWMLLQLNFQFKSFLLLGIPHLSVSLTLGTTLIANGIGGYFSNSAEFNKNLLPLFLIYFLIFIFGYSFFLNSSTHWSPSIQVLFFLALTAPISFIVGAIFPISLKKCSSISNALIFDFIGVAIAPIIFWILLYWGAETINYVIMTLYALLIAYVSPLRFTLLKPLLNR